MSENKENESKMDVLGLLLLLWAKRKRLFINCLISFALAMVIAFSIPKEYTSTVVMAPEVSSTNSLGDLGEVASLAGFNLGNMAGGAEALYPELYPQIITSTPFLMGVLSATVETVGGDSISVYDYLHKHTKKPWWSWLYSATVRLFKKDSASEEGVGLNAAHAGSQQQYSLTKLQHSMLKKLEKCIEVDVDKGNSLVTVNVAMQDKRVAASVANIISEKLRNYIEEYRSAKARKELVFYEQQFEECKEKYMTAQSVYAEYANLHQNVVNKKYQVELLRLQNEMDLAYGRYSQMAQVLEMSRAKVQENTPVCVVIQPAYVPIKASSPKKIMMAALYVFLAFFGTSAWIIVKERIVRKRC